MTRQPGWSRQARVGHDTAALAAWRRSGPGPAPAGRPSRDGWRCGSIPWQRRRRGSLRARAKPRNRRAATWSKSGRSGQPSAAGPDLDPLVSGFIARLRGQPWADVVTHGRPDGAGLAAAPIRDHRQVTSIEVVERISDRLQIRPHPLRLSGVRPLHPRLELPRPVRQGSLPRSGTRHRCRDPGRNRVGS